MFLLFCRMTCLGGSEKGRCSCDKPAECTMRHHPDYPRERIAAIERMTQLTKPS